MLSRLLSRQILMNGVRLISPNLIKMKKSISVQKMDQIKVAFIIHLIWHPREMILISFRNQMDQKLEFQIHIDFLRIQIQSKLRNGQKLKVNLLKKNFKNAS
jgi:hypothetical protein